MFHLTPSHVHDLVIEDHPAGDITTLWLHIINNGIGEPIRLPLLVARGKKPGPTLGLIAAVHGNELNGLPVIQRLFSRLDVDDLCGSVVGVLAVNVPGVVRGQRPFNDGVDLNRIAPGKPDGTASDVFIHRFIKRVITKFNYLIDLHTASFGRINTHYVRADMDDPGTARLARLQNPELILHNQPTDSSVRGAAEACGAKAVTVELKDPHVFQFDVIEEALTGVMNTLYDLKMLSGQVECPMNSTTICRRSYWIYSDEGGILHVLPKLGQALLKGDKIAEVRSIFGRTIKEYFAPEDGIVIGKSVDPINQTGSRIIHLGLEPEVVRGLPPII